MCVLWGGSDGQGHPSSLVLSHCDADNTPLMQGCSRGRGNIVIQKKVGEKVEGWRRGGCMMEGLLGFVSMVSVCNR